jgi:hypothetical protein
VCSEYNKRIDVACIDVEKAPTVRTRRWRGLDTYIYNLPVFLGIELKYRSMGLGIPFTKCVDDYTKLTETPKRLVPHPVVLGFVQDHGQLSDFLSSKPDVWQLSGEQQAGQPKTITIVTPREKLVYAKSAD